VVPWTDLEAQFRALVEPLRWVRLDYQWGAAGIYYRIAGSNGDATRRFEVLAEIAGRQLVDLPGGTIPPEILAIPSPTDRWYELLKARSGAFEHGLFGWQSDDAGNHMGDIMTGHIQSFAEASAVMALRLSVVPIATQTLAEPIGILDRLNSWLAGERQKRGAMWAVVGFLVIAALALLSL
jgi:hypothetical protein